MSCKSFLKPHFVATEGTKVPTFGQPLHAQCSGSFCQNSAPYASPGILWEMLAYVACPCVQEALRVPASQPKSLLSYLKIQSLYVCLKYCIFCLSSQPTQGGWKVGHTLWWWWYDILAPDMPGGISRPPSKSSTAWTCLTKHQPLPLELTTPLISTTLPICVDTYIPPHKHTASITRTQLFTFSGGTVSNTYTSPW